MSELLQDTWHDMRQKRLLPVAVLLLLAIVAIPALLTKSAAQVPASVPVVAEPKSDERLAIALDGEAPGSTGIGSVLDRFEEGDPFTPPDAIAKSGGGTATATSAQAGPGGNAPGAGAGGDTTGGGAPPSSSPDAPAAPGPPIVRSETAEYQYVVDVTFWNGERRRTIRGLRKLDMLPNQSAPVLILMGTEGNGGNAVFLVDSTLKAAGEGRCVPAPANCAYVHVGPGSEHAFTTEEGESYRLRVDEIRRVKLDASRSRARRPSARTSVGDGAAVRRFALPSLVDLVAVTETETVQAPAADAENGSSVEAGGR